MENKEMTDAMSSRRLLPPLYPGSPTTTNLPRAGNSHHHQQNSRRSPFQNNPAATAHFASQAGSGSSSYQQPPSPLSRMTHASAGVGGSSNTVSQDIFFGSGYAGGSSSSPVTDLASLVGLAPLPCTQPPLSWSVDQASSGSGFPAPLLTQGTANVDLGFKDKYVLPPLPQSLVGPQAFQTATVVDLEAVHDAPVYISLVEDDGDSGNKVVQYVDLEGPGGGLNSSGGRRMGSTSNEASCPPLPPTSLLLPALGPAEARVKKEDEDWTSRGMSQRLGNNGITSGGSSSSWMPQPYSSGNTRNGITHKAPWTPVQLTSPVKKEDGDWSSRGMSQIGNNSIASGCSSSAWMPQSYSSGNTGNGITKAPWTPVQLTSSSSSSTPATAAEVRVKKEAVDWSWLTSTTTTQRGKNTITSGGSSSTLMPQPYSGGDKDIMVSGSKRKLHPSLGTGWGSSGAAGSSSRRRGGDSSQFMDDANAPFIADFADGLFNQNDIDKIMADQILANMVLKDPRRVRGLLGNRSTAEKSIAHLSDLERQVERLQQENKSLFAQLHSLQSTTIGLLTAENNEMRNKLHGYQHEMQLKNDMNKKLDAEVRRLKLIVGENMGSHVSKGSYQEMMQPVHPRKHNRQLAQIQQEQELRELDNFIKQ